DRDQTGFVFTPAAVERNRWLTQHQRERAGTCVAARRTVIGSGLTVGHRFRIRPASAVAALTALGLRQQPIHPLDQGGAVGRRRAVDQRTGMPGWALLSASSRASWPASNPADRIIPSLIPKRILRGARLAMNTTLRPTSAAGSA